VPERIPDTVQALIAARIDRLAVDEKRVLQSAALVGRVFWRSALDRLAPDVDVAAVIDALLARDFVVPEERSTISRDRAFRFKHVLIRDVAYGGMSKTQRAEEHQAFAAWVGERAHDELAEIRAYHLDQAARLLARLEGAVPDDLAGAAAGALEEAGRRALRRGAFLVARRTLLRAVELEPTPGRRYLAAHAAWRLSDVPTVREEAEEALADARAAGMPDVEGRALILLAELALHAESDVLRADDLADAALAILPVDELAGLYDAHSLISTIFWWLGDAAGATRRGEAMLDLAYQANRPELESLALTQLVGVEGVQGHNKESLELLDRAAELAEKSGSREAAAFALAVRARRAHPPAARSRWRGSPKRANECLPAPYTSRWDAVRTAPNVSANEARPGCPGCRPPATQLTRVAVPTDGDMRNGRNCLRRVEGRLATADAVCVADDERELVEQARQPTRPGLPRVRPAPSRSTAATSWP
jgi:tetratricopeptide (TPR) repeat protein